MNPLKKEYFYKKQLNGKGRFGGVELELITVNSESKIIDKCEWKDWKKYNTDFKETPLVKSIKDYILNAMEYILQNFNSQLNFEISLIDIRILPVDTLPSHILASAIIGVFDLIGQALNETEIKKIDKFIIQNQGIEFPNYEKLILGIVKLKCI